MTNNNTGGRAFQPVDGSAAGSSSTGILPVGSYGMGDSPMRSPFFSTPEKVAALRAAAERWVGTPFAPQSAIHGPRGGVCCHRAVVAIISEAGFPWTQDEVPDGTLNRATHHTGSQMDDWLGAHPDRFARIPVDSGAPSPGDILLIRLGMGTHHAAVMLDRSESFQALQRVGAHIASMAFPLYGRRISHIYRPVVPPTSA